MSVRKKAFLVIAVILAGSAAALHTVATAIMNQNTFAIEQQDTKNNVKRAKEPESTT